MDWFLLVTPFMILLIIVRFAFAGCSGDDGR